MINPNYVDGLELRIKELTAESDEAWKNLREIRDAVGALSIELTADEISRLISDRDAALAQNTELMAQVEFLKKEIEFSANAIFQRMPTDEIHSITCGLLEAASSQPECNLREIQADAIASINLVDFTSVAFRHVERWPKGFEIEDFRTAFDFISEKVRDGRAAKRQGGEDKQ